MLWNLDPKDWEQFKVGEKLTDGESGIWRVKHFHIEEDDPRRLLYVAEGRDSGWGDFVSLGFKEDDHWHPMMTDTKVEIWGHYEAIDAIAWSSTKRVLINGLGLGMVLNAALQYDHVEHIDVVDNSWDVIKLVAPAYTADPRVHVHHADAFNVQWPRNTRWNVVWHDIWPTISSSNLPEMTRLKRKYQNRCDWQAAWEEDKCRWLRDEENKSPEQMAIESWKNFERVHGRAQTAAIKEFLEEQLQVQGAVPIVAMLGDLKPEEASA